MDSAIIYALPVCWTLRGDEMKRRLLAIYAHAFHYRIQTSDALVGNQKHIHGFLLRFLCLDLDLPLGDYQL